MMDRREFIKAMAAAGALPAFLDEGLTPECFEPEFYPELAGIEPGKFMTGISWYCHFSGSGQLVIPRKPMDQTLEVQVEAHANADPRLEFSIISLIRGGRKVLEHLTQGEVDMVYVMFETFLEDGSTRYFSQGGRVT